MKKKGFTLIELIIVIAIIGILAGILIPSWMNWISKGKIKTQNQNARVAFNASQTIVQEYKFKERKVDAADRNIGSGDFYYFWDGSNGSVIDSAGAVVAADADFVDDFAAKVNRIYSNSDTSAYKVYVENYLVKSVVCASNDTNRYKGSYPVAQKHTNVGNSVSGFDMSALVYVASP